MGMSKSAVEAIMKFFGEAGERAVAKIEPGAAHLINPKTLAEAGGAVSSNADLATQLLKEMEANKHLASSKAGMYNSAIAKAMAEKQAKAELLGEVLSTLALRKTRQSVGGYNRFSQLAVPAAIGAGAAATSAAPVSPTVRWLP